MSNVLFLFAWNLLIAAVMALTVWLACRTPPLRRRPAICHGLWLLVLLKLVTPPIIPVPLLPTIPGLKFAIFSSVVKSTGSACACCAPIGDDSKAIANQANRICTCSAETATLAVSESPTSTGPPHNALRTTGRTTLFALLGFSLFVSCALWTVAARRFIQMRRLLRGSTVESGRAAELLRQVSQQFNLRAAVKLQIVDASITPMLWAMPGNPAIILPRQLADSLSDDGLRSIFAHELAHYLRRDHWVNLFASVVTTLWWWNPLVWWVRRHLSASAEACCDAAALQRLRGSRKTYAQTLLTVVDSLTAARPRNSALGIAFAESQSLRRRFELIADANVKAHNPRIGWILAATCFAAMMFIPARAQENSAPPASSAKPQSTATGTESNDVRNIEFSALCCPS